jgi:hypothetical protein
MRRWAIINVLLGLVVALLALEIVQTWARGLPAIEAPVRSPVPERKEKGKRNAAARGAAQAQQAPPAMVASIGERDLFDPSRRAPTEEAKVEAPKESGPPAGLTVVGVRIFGKDREVFITDATQGNAQRRLRVGDQVVGYTIKAISPTGLTLTAPSGDAVTMPLEVEKGKGQAVPRAPGRPGQPGVPPASPAAGIQPTPPVRSPQPVPGQPLPPGARPTPPQPQAVTPGQNPAALQQMPPELRQKLEQLKQHDATPRLGTKR